MMRVFLIFGIVNAFHFGQIPRHIIKNINRGHHCGNVDIINCGDGQGYISKCYTINNDAPLIIASIEKQQNENYTFMIKIHSNYFYNHEIECISYTLIDYNFTYFDIIELTDKTYFIMINKMVSYDEILKINNHSNTFVEFYNETHTGIRWHDHDDYCSESKINAECHNNA